MVGAVTKGSHEQGIDTFRITAAEIRLSKESVTLLPRLRARPVCEAATGVVLNSGVLQHFKLGQKWIVSATSVDVGGCLLKNTARLSVLHIEDLEEVSNKLAKVIVEGKTLEEAVEVGNVTQKEQQKARLREGNDGLSLRVGAAVPVQTLADNFGVMVDVGYWFEALDFAIEPALVSGRPGKTAPHIFFKWASEPSLVEGYCAIPGGRWWYPLHRGRAPS